MALRRHDRQTGLGLLEVLIAGTIFAFVMLGMSAAVLSSSLLSRKSHDISWATDQARTMLEEAQRRGRDPLYFANLPRRSNANLLGLLGGDDRSLRRYALTQTAMPPTVVTLRDSTPGNNVVIKLSAAPSAAGILDDMPVTLYYPPTNVRQTVVAIRCNDAARQFQVSDTAVQSGRQGLQNPFPAGTLVLVGAKLVTVSIGYAAAGSPDTLDPGRPPLVTLSSYVNNPVQ